MMVRVVAALTALVPAAGQLFALRANLSWPWSYQLLKPTPTLEGLRYIEVGPEHLDVLARSSSTCVDSPSGMLYFVGAPSSQGDSGGDCYLYGISTTTGEQASQFKLPMPNISLMFLPLMEWKLGCDQSGGVLLYGEWQGLDPNPPKEERTLWRYNVKTQALEGLAQLDANGYSFSIRQSYPIKTSNQAVDAEEGLVSIFNYAYAAGDETVASLTLVNTTNGTTLWQEIPTLDRPGFDAQVYDPVKKRFLGLRTFWDLDKTGEIRCACSWWDATTRPQDLQVWSSSCGGTSAVDPASRAAFFNLDGQLTVVSLDSGEILSQSPIPDEQAIYLYAYQQTASWAPELVA